jgi:hypothetical protein
MGKLCYDGVWIHLQPMDQNHIETNFGWQAGLLFVAKIFLSSTNFFDSITPLSFLHRFLSINFT